MKKVVALILSAVMLLFVSSGLAVQIVYNKPICKFEERLIFETGVGLKKEYKDCASFSDRNGKDIDISLAVLTNIETGQKTKAVFTRFVTLDNYNEEIESIGIIDEDESAGLLKTLNYIKEHIDEIRNTSQYSELYFKARGGLEIGTVNDAAGTCLYISNTSDNQSTFIDLEKLDEMIDAYTKAHEELNTQETNYENGQKALESGNYEQAVTDFMNAGDYGDAKEQLKEAKYRYAENLKQSGNYKEAYKLYVSIKGYKDVDSLLTDDDNLKAVAESALEEMYTVGTYLTFGRYPQKSSGTDKMPIEWQVLARDGQKALLVSRYALDCKQYNTKSEDVTWETCTLRSWLNGDYLNNAFTPAEQEAIVTTEVDNGLTQGNPEWKVDGGNNTQDKVFLLSYQEASKYFANDEARKCAPTDYAIKNNAYTNGNYQVNGRPTCWWWLRSPGSSASSAGNVYVGGGLGSEYVSYDFNAVRPALWVNLGSEIF